jgi:hypothetical protein
LLNFFGENLENGVVAIATPVPVGWSMVTGRAAAAMIGHSMLALTRALRTAAIAAGAG